MSLVAPQYAVPSRTTITSRIGLLYEAEKAALMTELKTCKSATITTDTWTSTSTDSYLTVTTHFVNDDWAMRSCVLMTRGMPERHTGANLADRLNE